MSPNGINGTNGQAVTVPAARRLRQLLADESKIVVAPGVYDGFSARIALEVGFDCIYMVIKTRSTSPSST
jgi:2-methylisocitrate lyase-like PEP mutase family enzyme